MSFSSSQHPRALLTGATGMVGPWLVAELIKADFEVTVIVRSSSDASAQERADRVLKPRLNDEQMRRVRVIEGDISLPNCGIDEAEITAGYDVFWHCAADTRFDEKYRDSIFKANLEGTRNCLSLAKACKIRNFCHVSTTYVCGPWKGVAPEYLQREPQCGFNNPYEESKFLAERMTASSGLNWVVFRLPIIIGDSKTGEINGFTGYYAYFREFWRFKNSFVSGDMERAGISLPPALEIPESGVLHLPLQVPGRSCSILTMSCVDFVAEAMVQLALLPRAWEKAYHLVPEESRPYKFWVDTTLRYMGIEGVGIAEEEKLERSSSEVRFFTIAQRRIMQGIKPYMPYISSQVVFQPGNMADFLPHLRHPQIDKNLVDRLLDYAVERRFGGD